MSSIAIQAATSPAVDAEGFFTQGVALDDHDLAPGATSYQSAGQLAPGTYYVHVAAYNPAAPNCADPYSAACTWEFSDTLAVTIPADPAPPGPGPGPSPGGPGGSNPVVTLTVAGASTQKALKAKAISLRATCDQACTLTASGTLTIPGASKTYRLKSVRRSLSAGKRVTLKLRLSTKVIRTARRALRSRKRIRARVRLVAQNSNGRKTSRKTIRITG
jgi:hypothetical protein